MLTLINPSNFRHCVLFSTLSERPVFIEGIREDNNQGGLTDYETKFLKLFETLQNGCKVQISQSGKRVKYFPGVIVNTEIKLDFDCGTERSISYFLEPLLILSIFGKNPLNIELKGITNDELDISVDNIIYSTVSLMKKFDCDIQVKIEKRGFKPLGNGLVSIKCQPIKFLKVVDLTEIGKYNKIRGSTFGGKISSQFLNRMISSAREVLNSLIPDVWVYSDLSKNCESPGYGIALMAESDKGSLIIADEIYEASNSQQENTPEAIGQRCALRLMDELYFSGYLDSQNQSTIFILMSLSQRKISKVSVKRLSQYGLDTLKLIKTFFGVQFSFDSKRNQTNDAMEDEQENQAEMIYSCMGIGLQNLNRVVK